MALTDREVVLVNQTTNRAIRPIQFGPLSNLHLEMLEDGDKVKEGAPTIVESAPKPTQPSVPKPVDAPRIKKKKKKKQPIAYPVSDDEADSAMSDNEGPDDSNGDTDQDEIEFVSEHDMPRNKQKSALDELAEEMDDSSGLEDDDGDDDDDDELDDGEEDETDMFEVLETEPVMTEEEQRRAIMTKCRRWKRQYPDKDIPIFTEHSDLGMMKTFVDDFETEDRYNQSIHLYKRGFKMLCRGSETVATEYLGVQSMRGFGESQIMEMDDTYSPILAEMAETSALVTWYVNQGPEVRLVLMFTLNAAIHMWTNNKIADMRSGAPNKPRRMRGPDLDM